MASPLFLLYSLLLFVTPLLAAVNGNCNCNYYAGTQGTSACRKACNPSREAAWESPVRQATTLFHFGASVVDFASSVNRALSGKRDAKENSYHSHWQDQAKGKEQGGAFVETVMGAWKTYNAAKTILGWL